MDTVMNGSDKQMVRLTLDEAKDIEYILSKLYRNSECGWVNSYPINESELRHKLEILQERIKEVD